MIDFTFTALPLVPYLPRVSAALAEQRVLVLTAEPGAGKSTLVPGYLIDEAWLDGASIVMLEPRRLAAVAVATRIAELLGEPVGRRAGYVVRGASRTSGATRIEVVTEALLTRRIQEDPLLGGVGLVIIDEYHERSIHADLALALGLEVRKARPELALLVMSATLDAGAVARLLSTSGGSAPSLHCAGSVHPVATEYRPLSTAQRPEEGFADGVEEIVERTEGDVLGFLPGAGEIARVGARLEGRLRGRVEILPLHGTLHLEEQQRVIRPRTESRRRVILSTSIAETSLTVPGIRTVADSGYARMTRFHRATGLDRLVTERVSAASADQRRGRAGRLGPGWCVRFWPQSERLLDHADPEILRSDLAGLVLECLLWGARSPGELAWLDPPTDAAWQQAVETLRMLGLARDLRVTEAGRAVARLGLAPRLGVLVSLGAERGQVALAAACSALLQDRDGSGVAKDPDFRLRLEMLRLGAGGSEGWRRAAHAEMGRILRRVARTETASWTAAEETRVGNLLAHAFPDRLGRREPDGSFRLVTGRIARFPLHVPSRAAASWIVAVDADPGETTGMIRLAAPVEEAESSAVLGAAADEVQEIRWEGLVPKAVLARRVGRIVLTERPVRPDVEDVRTSFVARVLREGPDVLPWNGQARRLLSRMRFLSRTRPELGLGDLSDAGLAVRAGEWLGPFLSLKGGQVLSAGALHSALLSLLGSQRHLLNTEAPESITLPTGGKRAIDYDGTEPAVEVRIQEVFGLGASPRICGVPLTFRLLSPAQRPLQITRDLASFWATTYAEVRGEMRGRYPRHYWPEDPLQAEPTSRPAGHGSQSGAAEGRPVKHEGKGGAAEGRPKSRGR